MCTFVEFSDEVVRLCSCSQLQGVFYRIAGTEPLPHNVKRWVFQYVDIDNELNIQEVPDISIVEDDLDFVSNISLQCDSDFVLSEFGLSKSFYNTDDLLFVSGPVSLFHPSQENSV